MRRIGFGIVGTGVIGKKHLEGNFSINDAFEILRPWVQHVHMHDSLNRDWIPIGKGEINHQEVVSTLLSHKYEGYLSGEWIDWNEPYTVYLRANC